MRTASLLLLATLALLPTAAAAECRWERACDEAGDCVRVPVCRSAWDVTPVPPVPSLEPVAAPAVEPMEPPLVPSVASRCELVRHCTADACDWETICD